jgi:hypothetical protein
MCFSSLAAHQWLPSCVGECYRNMTDGTCMDMCLHRDISVWTCVHIEISRGVPEGLLAYERPCRCVFGAQVLYFIRNFAARVHACPWYLLSSVTSTQQEHRAGDRSALLPRGRCCLRVCILGAAVYLRTTRTRLDPSRRLHGLLTPLPALLHTPNPAAVARSRNPNVSP